MEDLPAWPASVFKDPTTLEMTRTGLAITKNKEFTATVKKWREKAKVILHDIYNATEVVQMELTSAREFLHCQTLTDSRVNLLKTQCKEHSKAMSDKWKELFNQKTNEFMKVYSLSLEGKTYVKEELK